MGEVRSRKGSINVTFEDGVRLQDLLLYPGMFPTDGGKVLQKAR